MEVRTVKVSNASLTATEQDIKEFFSFSGEIEYVEMHSDTERSQIAYITFKNSQGAETAVLLSGATIVDQSVTIELAPDYKPPPSASARSSVMQLLSAKATKNTTVSGAESVIQKAEDVVSTMLAKGFVLGKDAINSAKAFDEKLRLTSTAASGVVSLDQKIGLSEKISAGTTLVGGKMKEVDEKFRVSETTKSALSAAGQTVNQAGSAIMKNRYILTGASWVTGAFSRVAKTAEEVGQKTKEKVLADEVQAQRAERYVQLNESGSPLATASGQISNLPSK